MCCKPSFDKAHPEVCCVLCQGYSYGVVPEPKLCKGSQQAFCIQNRCSLPCDDEVPSTCTCCGYQRCRGAHTTKESLELVPFLPYPEVRRHSGQFGSRPSGHGDLHLQAVLNSIPCHFRDAAPSCGELARLPVRARV